MRTRRGWPLLPRRRRQRRRPHARMRRCSGGWPSACSSRQTQQRRQPGRRAAAAPNRCWTCFRSESRCWRRKIFGCGCRPRPARRRLPWRRQRQPPLPEGGSMRAAAAPAALRPQLQLQRAARRGRRLQLGRMARPTGRAAAAACWMIPQTLCWRSGRPTSGCRRRWRRCRPSCGWVLGCGAGCTAGLNTPAATTSFQRVFSWCVS